jgi:hypothetical protein
VLPNGKVEITVESEDPFDAWLPRLEDLLRQTLANEGH